MQNIDVYTGETVRIAFDLTLNGVGLTGQSPGLVIRRGADSKYWTGADWSATETIVYFTEYSDTIFPGLYIYTFLIPASADYYRIRKLNGGTYAADEYMIMVARVSVPVTFAVDLDTTAIEYDFTTYSKAVMLFYNQQRPFSGNPIYWCYVYTAAGSKPSTAAEIGKRDQVIAWDVSTPV